MIICQCSTVHKREDLRVFYKTSVTLANAGYTVYLIVADGKGDEVKQGVKILDLGAYNRNVKKRFLVARKLMLNKILELNPSIVQLHDPELLTISGKIKRNGIKVIFDSHEDVTKQILYKSWIGPKFLRKLISKTYNPWEKWNASRLDAVVSVIDEITNKFKCKKTLTVRNFPILDAYSDKIKSWDQRENWITYVGSFTFKRGILDYVEAMAKTGTDLRLQLIGEFESNELYQQCKASPGWEKVDFHGYKTMDKVAEYLGKSKLGLAVLHPEQNYITSLPTKGFEYMATGTPMIVSDFEYWKPYFKDTALFIEPQNAGLLACKLDYLMSSPDKLIGMHKACLNNFIKFSWEVESLKLIELYNSLVPVESKEGATIESILKEQISSLQSKKTVQLALAE